MFYVFVFKIKDLWCIENAVSSTIAEQCQNNIKNKL